MKAEVFRVKYRCQILGIRWFYFVSNRRAGSGTYRSHTIGQIPGGPSHFNFWTHCPAWEWCSCAHGAPQYTSIYGLVVCSWLKTTLWQTPRSKDRPDSMGLEHLTMQWISGGVPSAGPCCWRDATAPAGPAVYVRDIDDDDDNDDEWWWGTTHCTDNFCFRVKFHLYWCTDVG